MNPSDRPARARPWVHWLAKGVGSGLAGLLLIFAIASNVMEARTVFFAPDEVGDLGAKFQRTIVEGRTELTLRDVEPGSPLAGLGLRDGDRVRLDRPWDDLRTLVAGERLAVTRLADGGARRHQVVVPMAEQLSVGGRLALNLNLLANLPLLLVSLFMMWRSKGDRAIIALGMAFACMGAASPYRWPTTAGEYPVWNVVLNAGFALIPWLLLHFTMEYCGRNNARPVTGRERKVFWPLVTFAMTFYALDTLGTLQLVPVRVFKSAGLIDSIMQASGFIISFYYLRSGMKRERKEEQTRYILLMIALVGAFFPNIVFILTSHVITPFRFGEQPWLSTLSWFLQVSGALIFAYAVFRHKILDIGFAINRTLVYTVVSIILLVTFVLGEWATGQIISAEHSEQSAFLNAAVALGLFLAFDRVRDFVDHYVKALFFRDWQVKEKLLSKFIGEARFFTDQQRLNEAFMAELSRFCGGVGCAIYWKDEDGDYASPASLGAPGMPVAADHALPAALREGHKPLELDGERALGTAALALPMLHRNDLKGFVVIDAKPASGGYRPDEIELMANAVQQIGMDSYALNLDVLEAEVARLRDAHSLLERNYAQMVAGMRPSMTA